MIVFIQVVFVTVMINHAFIYTSYVEEFILAFPLHGYGISQG